MGRLDLFTHRIWYPKVHYDLLMIGIFIVGRRYGISIDSVFLLIPNFQKHSTQLLFFNPFLVLNPFNAAALFPLPLKTLSTQRFPIVYRGYRKRPVAQVDNCRTIFHGYFAYLSIFTASNNLVFEISRRKYSVTKTISK